jgi:hypothetical protein
MDTKVFAVMQEEKPYRTYTKRIIGKVGVKILNPFTHEEEMILLTGHPSDETAFLDVWSAGEAQYVEKYNAPLIKKGILVKKDRPEVEKLTEEEKYNQLSDEELDEILNSRWLKFVNALNKMTSEAPVHTMYRLAQEQEKSEKTITAIKARLSEIQSEKYGIDPEA